MPLTDDEGVLEAGRVMGNCMECHQVPSFGVTQVGTGNHNPTRERGTRTHLADASG